MGHRIIAVTGATGALGGRVASLLTDRGAPLRLVVRDPSRAPHVPNAKVRRVSGFGDRDDMRNALDGAGTLFLVPAEEAADRVAQHRAAVDAAVDAGVERIVYVSFLGAAPDSTFLLARDHWATEEHVRAAGVRWTFVRMSLYLDFLPSMVGPDGVLAGPADDGRFGGVARADVADVAAAVLAAGGHDGQTYDVTGPEALTLADAAAELSRLSGHRIAFRDETLDEARAARASERSGDEASGRGRSAPEWQVEAWISTYTAIAAGELDVVTDTVARLAGHEPRTLADVLRARPDVLDHVEA